MDKLDFSIDLNAIEAVTTLKKVLFFITPPTHLLVALVNVVNNFYVFTPSCNSVTSHP